MLNVSSDNRQKMTSGSRRNMAILNWHEMAGPFKLETLVGPTPKLIFVKKVRSIGAEVG